MVAKRGSNEYTTIRVRWISKEKFLKMAIGREIEADLFDRILKKFNIKVVKKENQAEYISKLNQGKRKR